MIVTALAAISLSIWIYLLIARGGFWRVLPNLIPRDATASGAIVAVVPARDEAANIGPAVRSLLAQSIPIRVIVIDDASSDGTADIACEAAVQAGASDRLTVIAAQPLPPGWTGKLWALSQGIEHALSLNPDYLLLTDADIDHGSNSIRELLALAQTRNCDLASLMVKLACNSLAERALIPAFVFFFLQLYPPAWIRDRNSKTAGAAGGCMLVRPAALERIGGIASVRNDVIDDCALARAIKRSGGAVWLGLTSHTHSIRPYNTFSEIGRMISRSAFNQLHHSTLLLIATALGLLLTYVVPLAAVFSGSPLALMLGLAGLGSMALCYLPMVRFYRRSWLWAFTLPPVALFYLGATIHSAVRYWTGRGGAWKGRVQDTRE